MSLLGPQNARTNNLKTLLAFFMQHLIARTFHLPDPNHVCNAAHLFALRPTIRVLGYLPWKSTRPHMMSPPVLSDAII
jgi:hypothetical protein